MFKKFLFTFLLLSVIQIFPQHINDLIQPVRLTPGEIDSVLISDLFYSDNYDVSFVQNEAIGVKYLPEQKIIVFNPSEKFKGIELIAFTNGIIQYVIPVISEDKFKRRFTYKPEGKPERINLFGSFNGWSRESHPMLDNDNDGVYETTMMIEPGRYEYKFFVDGAELVDNTNPEKVPNGMGDYNSILTIKSPDSAKTFLHKISLTEKDNYIVIAFALSPVKYVAEKNGVIPQIHLSNTDVVILLNNEETSVPVSSLEVGDRIIIRHNELIPADSILFNGEGKIDYSFVTGESTPVPKVSGELVYAGGRQIGSAIELEVIKEVSQSLMNHRFYSGITSRSAGRIKDLIMNRHNRNLFELIFQKLSAQKGQLFQVRWEHQG